MAFKDEDTTDNFTPIGPIFWVTKDDEWTPISNLWYTKGEAHRLANQLEVQLIEA